MNKDLNINLINGMINDMNKDLNIDLIIDLLNGLINDMNKDFNTLISGHCT